MFPIFLLEIWRTMKMGVALLKQVDIFAPELFVHIVTTILNALSPAMTKGLDASLVKVCTCWGDPFPHIIDNSIAVRKMLHV